MVAGDFADLFDNNGMPLPVGTSADPPTENGMPLRFVERDEVNLVYVAMTRSLCNLVIRSPDLNRLFNKASVIAPASRELSSQTRATSVPGERSESDGRHPAESSASAGLQKPRCLASVRSSAYDKRLSRPNRRQ